MLEQFELRVELAEDEQLRPPVLGVRLFVELQQRSLCGRHRQSADAVAPRLHPAVSHTTFQGRI